jgi:hypothetical protein
MRAAPLDLRFAVSSVLILILSVAILSVTAVAQEAGPQQIGGQKTYARPLINQAIDEGQRIVLKGNVHPLARAQFQVGTAPLDLPMQRMLLVLKRSPEQDQALLKLLDDQQDKSSASYHKWLTPEQFGQEFGPADSDLQAVTSWLQSHGFQIARVSKGRVMVEFSGTAAQIQEAFHTAIRRYVVNGETHWANASDPEIPAALAPVVAGVHTLHNFYMKPLHVISSQRFSISRQPGSAPQFTGSDGSHALVPADYAIIYNINPVYQAAIDGTGTTIAVVGRSEFIVQDVLDFQGAFSLPPNPPQIVNDGPSPGDQGGGEEAEATLDATWSAAVAPGATVKFVVSASTDTTDGIVLSELYIIENNVGDVMTESFGGCEAAISSTEAAGFEALAQEAAAQGITYVVSSGDTGTAGCDNLSEKVATGPVSASVLAATPFTVAVGGTMFNENGHDTTYWNTTNSALLASAKSYIPENVWNETCTTQCPAQASPLAASGGGVSVFFTKPSWQAGVAGIPADGFRDVPDVSLTAASHDAYLLCVEGSCQSGNAFGVSGTSASAPAFAGIMALVNQKTGSRQGQANYVLYKLAAAETLSQCNASNTTTLPANTCVFNDVTVGNNGVPGEPGYGTPSAQFQSTVGYDLTTGLGSVNVSNLLNSWSSVAFRATTTTLSLTPPTLTHGASANVNISVTPSSGTGTPTGDVSLLTNSSAMQGVTFFTLNGAGTISGSSDGLPGGTYAVHAHYAGDGAFAPSDSAPVTITVSPEASTTTLSVLAFDVAGNTIPFNSQPYGNPAFFRADVAGVSNNGTATGTVTFTHNAANIAGDPFSLNSEATASTAQGVFTMQPGPHAVVAHYNGDLGFNASTSSTVNVMVTKAPTTIAVASSSSSVAQGTPVTLTATVSTNSGGVGPSAQVTFLAGGTPIVPGSPVQVAGVDGSGNIQNGALTAAQGTAVSVITLPLGQNSITAQYSGDANYLASPASSAITVNVLPDFSFTAAAPSITVASPGGSGTVMLTITGQPGYNGTINFSATSCAGLPSESTCSFSPASVTGTGSTTLTIATTAAHRASLQGPGWWTTGLGGALAGIFLLGGASRRRAWNRLLSLMAFAFVITIAGCGGGGSSSGGGNTDPGTPAGTSTVTVTATSGTITHTATLTVNVQ